MYEIADYIQIFRDVLGIERETDIRNAGCEETEEWDSYMQLELVAAIEEKFQVRFCAEDVLGFLSFEDGLRILKEKDVLRER